jgi:hypothetical protein
MKPRIQFSLAILTVTFIALLTASPIWAQSNSPARVLRLGFIEGDVKVQRPDVQAWAEAPVNTPLEEGFKVSTEENSYAEIQFENGGAIRLGEHSLLDLTQLGLAPSGSAINRVGLRQGYATFHPLPSRQGDSLQVSTPYSTIIAPAAGARFRVDLEQDEQRVEVFDGSVDVQSNLGAMTISKDSVLIMQPGTSEPTVVSQGITKDDWDNWVDDREAHLQMPSDGPSPNGYGGDADEAVYGWNDLSQYGSWSDVPGEGYGWSPTQVANGWAPYTTGQWCWYPGWGYTWIGAEPWGWMPYHYGGWDFIPGRGWVWFPRNLNNWSPAQVTWFSSPNWIGWLPRHQKDDAIVCNNNCGGGVIGTAAFRNGGLLNSHLLLGFSPTAGERVKEPGVLPTMAVKLTGPAFPTRAAWPANATIVYDPQQNRFVNSARVVKPANPPASTAAANATSAKAANPGLVEPVPVGSRDQEARTVENPGYGQPNPELGTRPAKPASTAPRNSSNTYTPPAYHGTSSPKPAPSGSYGSPSAGHAGGGEAGGSHGGGGGGGGGGSSGGGHH